MLEEASNFPKVTVILRGYTYGKVSRIYELARNTNPQLDIAVDGGVNRGNIARLAACGARSFCAGSSVFGTESPNGAIDRLRALAMGR